MPLNNSLSQQIYNATSRLATEYCQSDGRPVPEVFQRNIKKLQDLAKDVKTLESIVVDENPEVTGETLAIAIKLQRAGVNLASKVIIEKGGASC